MSDDRPVTDLVTRARNGDQRAWDGLVERYAPLVWSICRSHQLSDADAGDVHQNIWRQLARQPDRIRDPAALAAWLAAATRQECIRIRNAAPGPHARGPVPDPGKIADQQGGIAEQELLAAERHAALREALARLPACCQQLIAMLLQDPPVTEAQISASLNIPAGTIRPRRGRCLGKLRRDPAIAALISAEAEAARSELPGKRVHSHDERSRAS